MKKIKKNLTEEKLKEKNNSIKKDLTEEKLKTKRVQCENKGSARGKIIKNHIVELLMKGKTNAYIIEDLMENWGVKTSRSARHYLEMVNKQIVVTQKEELELKIQKYKQMYMDLYDKAISDGNKKVAKEILDSIVKLEGITTVKIETKQDIHQNIDLTNISDDKLDEMVAKLLNNKNE